MQCTPNCSRCIIAVSVWRNCDRLSGAQFEAAMEDKAAREVVPPSASTAADHLHTQIEAAMRREHELEQMAAAAEAAVRASAANEVTYALRVCTICTICTESALSAGGLHYLLGVCSS